MRSIFYRSGRIAPLLPVFLLSLFAAPAFGGVFEGNGEIGFDFGWVDLDGRDYGEEGRFSIRGGYHFNDLFQLEGQILGVGTDGPNGVEALGGFLANAVFNWHPGERVVPYALVGLGVVETASYPFRHCHGYHGRSCHRGYDYEDYETSGAVQLGVGSRFFFGQGRTAFRIEGSLLAFEDDFDRGRELLSLSVGLTWRLGRYRPAMVRTVGGTE